MCSPKFSRQDWARGIAPWRRARALVGLAAWWGLSTLPLHILIPTVIAFIFFAVWVSSQACVLFNNKDPSKVTVDEIAGIFVTFIFHEFTWVTAVAGFVLFRIFDIAKPWPVCWADRKLAGGWGVVMDDVFAGVYANLALWIAVLILHRCDVIAG